jgi:hypothetical protein
MLFPYAKLVPAYFTCHRSGAQDDEAENFALSKRRYCDNAAHESMHHRHG